METSTTQYKKIPSGISDFDKIISDGYYYIDKSLFIRNILEQGREVTLIPRPRRFGKTINMTMLKTFFEKLDPSKTDYSILSQSKIIPILWPTRGSIR